VHRRWFINRTNPQYIEYLSKAASVSPALAQILINRGIKTLEEIDSFLNPRVSQLSDPFDMQGMKMSVDRILSAADSGERILVHGDYDADGLSATAIALKALKKLGIDCHPFIPNRIEHGYGFTPASYRKAREIGASLIITVDCGITSFEATALSKKEGIDVIITDHHEPLRDQRPEGQSNHKSQIRDHNFLLPDALAIINPKVSDRHSPVFNLSGAGIALKLAQALCTVRNPGITVHDFIDLAALGTMADVVPLTDENRIIVKEGLQLLDKGVRPGIRALKQVAGIDNKATRTGLLLFTLIPRINAAGRISDAGPVLDLLLTESEDHAIEISLWLDKLNSERQRIEEEVYRQALSMVSDKGVSPIIVLSGSGWNRGVIGIVASRITEKFYRPTFILSVEDGIARGSARSIPSFDIYRALGDCKDLLKGFGGHKQAAGLELDSLNISTFEESINRIAGKVLAGKDFVPSLEIDVNVDLADIGFDLLREFEMLEPFGFGNPEPSLGSKGLEVLYPKIVKDKHLKMKLRHKTLSLDAIGFNMAAFFEKLGDWNTVDAVYSPSVNEWEGRRSIQLNLKALRQGLESWNCI
jgi:single-stranded-DNA-specific exonuclease